MFIPLETAMTELKPHVLVVQHPNSRIREFHFVREVANTSHMSGFGENSLFGSFHNEDIGERAKLLARMLQAVPGVIAGNLKRYSLSVTIADAFTWQDVGPLVLGEIIKAIHPEVVGYEIEISARIGWNYYAQPSGYPMFGDDDGHRIRYRDVVKREVLKVEFGASRPSLDIEHMLGDQALQKAKEDAQKEVVTES